MARTKKPKIIGIKIRLANELSEELKAAAKANNDRSFNAEIVHRLGRSVNEDAALGGARGRDLLFSIATAFIMAGSHQAGHRDVEKWIKDSEAYNAAMFAAIAEMMIDQPDPSLEKCLLQIESLKGRIATRLANRSKS